MPSDVAVGVGRRAGMSPRQQVQPRFATGRANDAASLLPGAPKLLDVPVAARFRRRNGRHNCQAGGRCNTPRRPMPPSGGVRHHPSSARAVAEIAPSIVSTTSVGESSPV